MTPQTMGRRPITIVELEQPRCSLRHGVLPCTATGTKCYNTAGTCGDLPNFTPTGSIKWRFTDDRVGFIGDADFSDPDNLELPPIPCGVQVSTSQSQINAGSNLDGRSPLGVTGKVTITIPDFQWDDMWGDFYLSLRAGFAAGRALIKRGPFWALWTARNALFKDMFLRIYDGYEGQALADMRQRLFVLDSVDGPNSDGQVTLTGLDPLRLAGDKKAEFPRTSKLDVYSDIDAVTTTVKVFGTEADLSDAFGNTGTRRYMAIGNEIVQYGGYTADGDGVFTLTGVVRGALETIAEAHEDKEKVQRAGRYEAISFWLVLHDLFANHTEMPAAFIPLADWNTEGNTYLPTYKATRTVVEPTQVSTLAGEITQQGLFYIWWDEYEQEVKLLAVRPPDTDPAVLTDDENMIRGTELKRDPSIRLTQVAVYYNQLDVFGGKDDDANYLYRFVAIDGDNMGEKRSTSIYAPWVTNRTQAVQLAVRLLIRYRAVPKFLSVSIDAKDRDTAVGSVVDIETSTILDSEGNLNRQRWQVISAKEIRAGHSYMLDLQTYEFVGRFGRYMADGSPIYDDATEEERGTGAWYAGADGLMPDGTEGYQYQ